MGDMEAFLADQADVIKVWLSNVRGSSPRETGTAIYVSKQAVFGTIGGGQLEFLAIEKARAMLAAGDGNHAMDVPLGPDIGQCCGGHVSLDFAFLDDEDRKLALHEWKAAQEKLPYVYLFGAGHVGRALAKAFALLPVRVVLIDNRVPELDLATDDVEKRLEAIPESLVETVEPGSACLVATYEHALDFLISAELLKRTDIPYVGMIGSGTKRASFHRFMREHSDDANLADRLICPIGGAGKGDRRPEVIAAFVVSEVMSVFSEANVEASSSVIS